MGLEVDSRKQAHIQTIRVQGHMKSAKRPPERDKKIIKEIENARKFKFPLPWPLFG